MRNVSSTVRTKLPVSTVCGWFLGKEDGDAVKTFPKALQLSGPDKEIVSDHASHWSVH